MAVAAHKMAAGPRKEGTLNTCFVRVVDARPRKTMTPQQGFCSNVCVCVCMCSGKTCHPGSDVPQKPPLRDLDVLRGLTSGVSDQMLV